MAMSAGFRNEKNENTKFCILILLCVIYVVRVRTALNCMSYGGIYINNIQK